MTIETTSRSRVSACAPDIRAVMLPAVLRPELSAPFIPWPLEKAQAPGTSELPRLRLMIAPPRHRSQPATLEPHMRRMRCNERLSAAAPGLRMYLAAVQIFSGRASSIQLGAPFRKIVASSSSSRTRDFTYWACFALHVSSGSRSSEHMVKQTKTGQAPTAMSRVHHSIRLCRQKHFLVLS
jgi:hypothetical protein